MIKKSIMPNKRHSFFSALVALGAFITFLGPYASQADTVKIPSGSFTPLFGLDKNQTHFKVRGFFLDRDPVTQESFAEFLNGSPSWKKNTVTPLFADSKYLKDWNEEKPKVSHRKKPVVYISWYAAMAYCEAQKGRLPTTLEWEYAAAASATQANALKDSEFTKQILAWYAKPSGDYPTQNVGSGKPNFYGVRDLHGLVWEWTHDYNSSFITADNRQDGDKIKDFFCGGGSIGAENREDYAAFMRYAMRNSLNANFNVSNLGFRCAYDRK